MPAVKAAKQSEQEARVQDAEPVAGDPARAEEVFGSADVDAVLIATATPTHAD